jgi:hypothetical protein
LATQLRLTETGRLNMRLSAIRTVAVIVALPAWAGQPVLAQTTVVRQGGVSITGNLSAKYSDAAARAVSLNDAVGIGEELVTDAHQLFR